MSESNAMEQLPSLAQHEASPTAAAALDALYAPTASTFNRLSLPFPLRLPLLLTVSGFSGFCLGLAHGSTEAGLRFRAENAHRLPTSQTGWYLYHKSKNYHVLLGGIKEGFKMSGRLAVWTGTFVVFEELNDRGRAAVVRRWRTVRGTEEEEKVVAGNRDFLSTTAAGLGTAGAFAAWNHFPMATAVRLMKTGAKVGLAFGLAQDAVSLMRGRRLGYVEFVKRHTFGTDAREVGEGIEAAAG